MFVRQFSQGISVAGCAITSIVTLGWMASDVHNMEKKRLQNEYEKTIKILNDEIKVQKNQKSYNQNEL